MAEMKLSCSKEHASVHWCAKVRRALRPLVRCAEAL